MTYFKVVPNKKFHGKKLKTFYRRAYDIKLKSYCAELPPNWFDRPPVLLSQKQLDRLMDHIHTMTRLIS